MTKEQYERWSAPFRGENQAKALRLVNRLLTYPCYLAYPLALALLALRKDPRFWAALVVPAVSFLLLSVFRDRYNAKRPYEVLEIQPIIIKHTKGHSFPSRHVFSCFVIAMTFLWLAPPLGLLFLLMGAGLCYCRVVGGVHFPRDVAAGALVGILSGILGYWFIF
ncbi:MAG: phosphatase PAP2 family protein [Oscillospiraceae bacterium]|nr:phosphatase PAP2 family protein [Oscillospiraceae bacterium]